MKRVVLGYTTSNEIKEISTYKSARHLEHISIRIDSCLKAWRWWSGCAEVHGDFFAM